LGHFLRHHPQQAQDSLPQGTFLARADGYTQLLLQLLLLPLLLLRLLWQRLLLAAAAAAAES
jgi:hypothetical protein